MKPKFCRSRSPILQILVPGIFLVILQMSAHAASPGQAAVTSPGLPQNATESSINPLVPAGFAQSLNTLTDVQPFHMGFVFDRSMLEAMRIMMQSTNADSGRAAASIHSISVDNYRYSVPATYRTQSIAAIKDSFATAGWKHLVASHLPAPTDTPPGPYAQLPVAEQRPHPAIDLWLHFSAADIDGVVILTRSHNDMSVVQITCDLRPIDLLRLGGHFGIPKVDPSVVMVPDSSQK